MRILFTIIALLGVISLSSQTLLVEWTFPDNSADEIADDGIPDNLDKIIFTEGGTSAIQYKNGLETKAAQATDWDNGIYTKGWVISLVTTGYADLKLNSIQQSGGNDPGPKDWIIQYKIGTAGNWTDVTGNEYFVQNDWTSGAIVDLALPQDCDNQPLVFIRWLVTTNVASDSSVLLNTGKSKIDNISIFGVPSQSVQSIDYNKIVNVYPNPAIDYLSISNTRNISSVKIINQFGAEVINSGLENDRIEVSGLASGIYFLIPVSENRALQTIKFIKK